MVLDFWLSVKVVVITLLPEQLPFIRLEDENLHHIVILKHEGKAWGCKNSHDLQWNVGCQTRRLGANGDHLAIRARVQPEFVISKKNDRPFRGNEQWKMWKGRFMPIQWHMNHPVLRFLLVSLLTSSVIFFWAILEGQLELPTHKIRNDLLEAPSIKDKRRYGISDAVFDNPNRYHCTIADRQIAW